MDADTIEGHLLRTSKQGYSLSSVREFRYEMKNSSSDPETTGHTAYIILLERITPAAAAKKEYEVIPSIRDKGGKQGIASNISQGFRPVSLTSRGILVLERDVATNPSTKNDCSVEMVTAQGEKNIKKEIATQVERGWTIVNASDSQAPLMVSNCANPPNAIQKKFKIVNLPPPSQKSFFMTSSGSAATYYAEIFAKESALNWRYQRIISSGTFNDLSLFIEIEKGQVNQPEYLFLKEDGKAFSTSAPKREINYGAKGNASLPQAFEQVLAAGYQVKDLISDRSGCLLIFEK